MSLTRESFDRYDNRFFFAAGRPKIDFNSLKPPPGYVPGMGRGAAGFTTRSDIGPARYTGGDAEGGGGEEEKKDAPDQKFDKFMGSEAGMFSGGVYEEDDKEADKVLSKAQFCCRVVSPWEIVPESMYNTSLFFRFGKRSIIIWTSGVASSANNA